LNLSEQVDGLTLDLTVAKGYAATLKAKAVELDSRLSQKTVEEGTLMASVPRFSTQMKWFIF
jgi:hypothetical protein